MLEKDQTNETVFRKDYHQLRERISSCFKAYTDGSQREQKVAVATIFPEEPEHSLAVRLRDGSSVFNTEPEYYTPRSKEIFNFGKN